jgi:hypothetical protein
MPVSCHVSRVTCHEPRGVGMVCNQSCNQFCPSRQAAKGGLGRDGWPSRPRSPRRGDPTQGADGTEDGRLKAEKSGEHPTSNVEGRAKGAAKVGAAASWSAVALHRFPSETNAKAPGDWRSPKPDGGWEGSYKNVLRLLCPFAASPFPRHRSHATYYGRNCW